MIKPYQLTKEQKQPLLLGKLNELTKWHIENNVSYRSMLKKSRANLTAKRLEDVPYLPVQLFKLMELVSVPKENIVKILTSSGTTGKQVSKIFLDKETSVAQTRTLVEVIKPLIGDKR